MLQNENEYETPIESNYYQNNHNHSQNSDKTQNITDYTEQAFKPSSSLRTIYIVIQKIRYNYRSKKFEQLHFS